jgi:acetyltransferase-like isoleucine patch superfamily enzyme
MKQSTPIERDNRLLETTEPLTSEDKAKFAYFGVNAKILPPLRILNPQNIIIGDRVAIREGSHINAFTDLSFIREYIDARLRDDFSREDYLYDGRITIEHTCQIGRFSFMSCTRSIVVEPLVVMSERVFIGDNNHGFAHPEVPILQQPNDKGDPVVIGTGSWIGVGASILAGAILGRNTVVGSNSVVRAGKYPSHAIIASPSAEVLFRRHHDGE